MTTPLAHLGEVWTNGHGVVKACAGCGTAFTVAGKGSARALYCGACRAQVCSSCNARAGGHYPYCDLLRPRPCRGCGVELGHGGSHRWFCEACWANQCPECRVRAGRHGASCRYRQRRRRPGLTTVYGVVTEEEIVDLWLAQRARAIRIARAIVGDADAEDVVHDVTLYLLEKRPYLKDAPGRAYFLTAVKHTALRRLLYAWSRYVVAMDPETLVLAEQAMYDPTQPVGPGAVV